MKKAKRVRIFTALLLIITMIIGVAPVASAATMVEVYRNGELIKEVGAKLDGTKVLMPNYGALLKVLPELEGETFPTTNRDIVLADWAKKADVLYERSGTRVDIITKVVIMINGTKMYNTDVTTNSSGEVILPKGITSAKNIFPKGTDWSRVSNSTNAVTLKFVAFKLGYDFEQDGHYVYLTDSTLDDTKAIIVLNGIRLYNTDVIVDSSGELILPKGMTSAKTVFPSDTKWSDVSSSSEPVALKFIAFKLGYEFQQDGKWGYLTNNVDLQFRQNDKAVTFEYKLQGDKVIVKKAVLEQCFSDKLKDIKLVTAEWYDFTAYAEYFGYKVTRYQNYYWFRDDGKKPIMVDIEGRLVYFPDQQPVIKNGRTLVPVAVLANALGGTAVWNGEKQLAEIYCNRVLVEIFIGQKTYYIDKMPYLLDVPAEIIGNRTMIPLNATGVALGYKSEWDPGQEIDWIHMKKN